jgi:hypothetical protein
MQLLDVGAFVSANAPLAVFLIFLSPISPGAIAGILLARAAGLSPVVTIGLYIASDFCEALILDPILVRLTRRAHRSAFGTRFLEGFHRVGALAEVVPGRFGQPVGLFICTFATDFLTAAVISLGLRVSRLVAWGCIIAGDVVWFLIIFLASASLASLLTDNRIVIVVTLVLGIGLPWLVRRLIQPRPTPVRDRQEYPERLRSQPKDEGDLDRSRGR